MNILVAPDAFKGTLRADEAGRVIAAAIQAVRPGTHITVLPLSDGGEGCASILGTAAGAERLRCRLHDWSARPFDAAYWVTPSVGGPPTAAYLDAATVLNASLSVPGGPSVLHRSSTVFGVLLRKALETGAQQVYAGLGGTFTNDAGIGMAAALGYHFFDREGRQIPIGETIDATLPVVLQAVHRIEKPREGWDANNCHINALCDVTNPLTGSEGATHIYGPQKGLAPVDVQWLDDALAHFAACVSRDVGDLDPESPGSGAAGGLGFALAAFTGARLLPGADTVMRAVGFHEALRGVDMVITGEGRIDEQSAMGKVVGEVSRAARESGVPCIACAGTIRGDRETITQKLGLHRLVTVLDREPTPDDLSQAASLLSEAITSLFHEIGRL
ncbi:MAG: glycerate kinase [Ignavibacteriae bacterium]|nr:glycerate kinase [Ignavibacteriota bacterium]